MKLFKTKLMVAKFYIELVEAVQYIHLLDFLKDFKKQKLSFLSFLIFARLSMGTLQNTVILEQLFELWSPGAVS